MDDMRSLSTFSDIAWPNLHFTARSVFYWSAFYRLVCKIVNLCDIDLKFAGTISGVNNPIVLGVRGFLPPNTIFPISSIRIKLHKKTITDMWWTYTFLVFLKKTKMIIKSHKLLVTSIWNSPKHLWSKVLLF